MKKILLVSNYVFHYRVSIYNYFHREFEKLGYEFHVLSNEYQDVEPCNFVKHIKPFSLSGYIDEVRTIAPDLVINFLHLKDNLIFPLTIYCRMKGIPMIYWNHGVNLSKAHNKALNAVYRVIHGLSSAIILYTPNELRFISKRAQKKVFIAYNTLCFDGLDRNKMPDKSLVKGKYSIKEDKVILFISRVLPYKRLEVLLDNFLDEPDVAVVVVGEGITEQQMNVIDAAPNYYYLGPRYGREVDEIYSMGDVYSTPGHIGLGLNQALFWGKPVVVLNVRHAPEIYYLKNGKNGFLAKDECELKEKILYLLRNEQVYSEFSKNAIETLEQEANVARMFDGFRDAVSYCVKKKNAKNGN